MHDLPRGILSIWDGMLAPARVKVKTDSKMHVLVKLFNNNYRGMLCQRREILYIQIGMHALTKKILYICGRIQNLAKRIHYMCCKMDALARKLQYIS